MKLILFIPLISLASLHADTPKKDAQKSTVIIETAQQEKKLDYQGLTALILVKYGMALKNGHPSSFDRETMIPPCPIENPQEEYRYREDDKSIKIHAVLSAQDQHSLKNTFNTATRKLDDAIMQEPMPRHSSDRADIGTIKR